MDYISLRARAKINIALDVVKKRSDGYHDLRMIMQTIELHDVVNIEKTEAGIEVICDNPVVPAGVGNIAWRAAEMFLMRYRISGGVRIKIEKRIPIAAGLAGGSTDAAAVLKGMRQLFCADIDEDELMRSGKSLGADVPYCIAGGTMLAEGIGDVLNRIESFAGVNIVLVKPEAAVSTQWVYKNLDLAKISDRPDIDTLISLIKRHEIKDVAKGMVNVLETVTANKYKEIEIIKRQMLELGAEGSIMSGSGPTVFGIFNSRESAEKAYKAMKDEYTGCFITHTISEER